MKISDLEYSDANMALWDAKEGNHAALVLRLRNKQCSLSAGERDYLADFLEGKFKRSANRQRSWRLRDKRLDVAKFVAYQRYHADLQEKAAVSLAAAKFKRSEKSVRDDVKFAAKEYHGGGLWRAWVSQFQLFRSICLELGAAEL